VDEKKCPVIILEPKECGLPLSPIKKADGSDSGLYHCPEGHLSQYFAELKKKEGEESGSS
jgi:hypothetical protein